MLFIWHSPYESWLYSASEELKAISRKSTPLRGVNLKIAFNKKLFNSIQTSRNYTCTPVQTLELVNDNVFIKKKYFVSISRFLRRYCLAFDPISEQAERNIVKLQIYPSGIRVKYGPD